MNFKLFKNIDFSRIQKCKTCNGNKSALGSRPSKCYVCKSNPKLIKKCKKCKGTGFIIKNSCK